MAPPYGSIGSTKEEAGSDPDAGGPGEDAAVPACAELDGYPELTGAPTVPASLSTQDDLEASIPVDGDTGYVRIGIEDYAQSDVLLNNWAHTFAGPGSATATASIPDGTTEDDYYLTVDLCSTESCTNPFNRTTYERVGTGTTYIRVGYTSPPMTQTEDPCDTGHRHSNDPHPVGLALTSAGSSRRARR